MAIIQDLGLQEASYVSGLSPRDLNRMIDENLIPRQLIAKRKGTRRVSPLGVAMAAFYLTSSDSLSASFRKKIIQSAVKIAQGTKVNKDHFKLPVEGFISSGALEIEMNMIKVDVGPYIRRVRSSMESISVVEKFVSQDESVMSGRPVFKGTRVPIDLLVDSKGRSVTLEEAQEAYEFITKDHLEAARTFMKLHPQRGRPKRLSEANKGLKVFESGVSKADMVIS